MTGCDTGAAGSGADISGVDPAGALKTGSGSVRGEVISGAAGGSAAGAARGVPHSVQNFRLSGRDAPQLVQNFAIVFTSDHDRGSERYFTLL